MIKVSIIIPTYNYGRFLAESLDSVLAQNYDDYELIVVDDGSTDETRSVVDRYGDRVRYIHQEHAGVAVARNTGIAAAKGEYIGFHDADDVWLKGSLKNRVDMLDKHPELGLVFGDVTVVKDGKVFFQSFLKERKALCNIPKMKEKDNRVIFTRKVFSDLLQERFITIPTLLLRKKCFDEVGLWNPEVEGVEDYEFYLRAAKRYLMGYVDKPLAVCRIHGSNVSCNVQRQNIRRIAMLHRYENDPELPESDRRSLRLRMSELYLESAWFFRIDGDHKSAREHYLLSWSYNYLNARALLRYIVSAVSSFQNVEEEAVNSGVA